MDDFTIERTDRPGPAWDERIAAIPDASLFHHSGWSRVWEGEYGHEGVGLMARRGGRDLAACFLVRKPSFVLGRHWVAVPYFDAAAPIGDAQFVRPLVERAWEMAREDGAKFLEVRSDVDLGAPWPCRSHKVTVRLDLPTVEEDLLPGFRKKLRSQIKRGLREVERTESGGAEWADAFHAVYSHRMRELGSPAHGARLFRRMLEEFPEHARVVVVFDGDGPAAAAFLLGDGSRTCIPWASTLSTAMSRGLNMALYYECLLVAVRDGSAQFDFGRTTEGSGQYKFKMQWGGAPVPLHWYRLDAEMAPPEEDTGPGRAMQLVSGTWRRLPLGLTRRLGPLLVRQFS